MIEIQRNVRLDLLRDKYAYIKAYEFSMEPEQIKNQQCFFNDWQTLPADDYLQGGDCFRFRLFALFYYHPQQDKLLAMPSASYFQSKKHNRYAGGMGRSFAPIQHRSLDNPFLSHLIQCDFRQLPIKQNRLNHPWQVDVHQVRIRATLHEEGKPTPEEVHHDGEEFVCIHLVDRENVGGGITTVYDNQSHPLFDCSLKEPMDSMILWDPHVMHAALPITPVCPTAEATRDVLLIGFDPSPDLRPPT